MKKLGLSFLLFFSVCSLALSSSLLLSSEQQAIIVAKLTQLESLRQQQLTDYDLLSRELQTSKERSASLDRLSKEQGLTLQEQSQTIASLNSKISSLGSKILVYESSLKTVNSQISGLKTQLADSKAQATTAEQLSKNLSASLDLRVISGVVIAGTAGLALGIIGTLFLQAVIK